MLEAEIFPFVATAMVTPEPVLPLVSLAAFHGQTAALQAALGVALPLTPKSVRVGETLYLWSGPDAWLVVGGAVEALTTPFAAMTDQADGRSVFTVSGPHARDALAKLVPIDLHEQVFADGATALTLAGHIGVQIWREGEAFRLACFRSFAQSLYASLIEACREFED
ncbi:MAG: hypothetical protein B7Z75_10575 [Acidocella sp. 20-57-95]|nr:MAG: hypothetical protein B7Z75_10575 [Acidocella sp. 20-57-95]OYV55743.1 MAG: hypothetical protein B7Z71_13090 [Acidocella sp. 21-58-7]HQT64934.1 sarcosine oxidase subunit gamma family protein [Acidocella sp.]